MGARAKKGNNCVLCACLTYTATCFHACTCSTFTCRRCWSISWSTNVVRLEAESGKACLESQEKVATAVVMNRAFGRCSIIFIYRRDWEHSWPVPCHWIAQSLDSQAVEVRYTMYMYAYLAMPSSRVVSPWFWSSCWGCTLLLPGLPWERTSCYQYHNYYFVEWYSWEVSPCYQWGWGKCVWHVSTHQSRGCGTICFAYRATSVSTQTKRRRAGKQPGTPITLSCRWCTHVPMHG